MSYSLLWFSFSVFSMEDPFSGFHSEQPQYDLPKSDLYNLLEKKCGQKKFILLETTGPSFSHMTVKKNGECFSLDLEDRIDHEKYEISVCSTETKIEYSRCKKKLRAPKSCLKKLRKEFSVYECLYLERSCFSRIKEICLSKESLCPDYEKQYLNRGREKFIKEKIAETIENFDLIKIYGINHEKLNALGAKCSYNFKKCVFPNNNNIEIDFGRNSMRQEIDNGRLISINNEGLYFSNYFPCEPWIDSCKVDLKEYDKLLKSKHCRLEKVYDADSGVTYGKSIRCIFPSSNIEGFKDLRELDMQVKENIDNSIILLNDILGESCDDLKFLRDEINKYK